MNQAASTFFLICSILILFNDAIGSNNTSTTIISRSLANIEDPNTDPEACGRSSRSSVCDPDKILSTNQADELDAEIADIKATTKCACSTCRADAMGYTIGVALVKKMIISSTVQVATNTNDVHIVTLNAALSEAKEIAKSLLLKWNLGQCHDGVLVFFSSGDSILYTAVGSTAGLVLTDDLVGEISMNVRLDMNRNVSLGLHNMLASYKSVFLRTYKRTTNWDSTPDASAVVSLATHLSISSPIITFFITAMIVITSRLRFT